MVEAGYLPTAPSATLDTTDWYVDFGAPNDMSVRKDRFENYHAIDTEQVTCVGSQKLHTAGIADVRVNRNNGLRNITGVRHISNLSANLPSVSSVAKNGLVTVFNSEGCQISLNKDIQLIGECKAMATKIGGIYQTDLRQETAKAAIVKPSLDLWHRRLTHL
jgi:hypothetical protein